MNWFFYNNIILIPVITWLVSVILKWFFLKLNSKFSLNSALWSWWMPSVHSALVTSITTAIWIKHWIYSDLFVICLVFSLVVIYDAINVRYEAWLHAKSLNKITSNENNFNESLWHLPQEAFAWSIVWILTALLLMII